jgi:hypothetical protein
MSICIPWSLWHPYETIIYGDSGQGDVVGLGKIVISTINSIEDVYHVGGLVYKLLSVSQLCEKGYNCLFTHEGAIVFRREDSSSVFAGHLRGKLYYADFTKVKVDPNACLVAKSDLGWLWDQRLDHVSMRNLAKLQKDEHILGLRKVVFEKICCVVLVKSGSKLERIILPWTSYLHHAHWSYYTWTCLDQLPK